ncbi:hypothetical protein [Roseibium algae]|uniref:Uncharacterized protein n=1 Tax=Roseibium algae TaxID=3123038 RepID=A0ABU8TPG8_9HYPH
MKLTSAGLLFLLTAAAMTLFVDFERVNAHTADNIISAQLSK